LATVPTVDALGEIYRKTQWREQPAGL